MRKIKSRNAMRSSIAGIISPKVEPPSIFAVAAEPEISTGRLTGKSKNERSKVFPSENITSAEMKEPADASESAPRKNTKRISALNAALRNTTAHAKRTISTRKSSAAP